MSSDPYEQGRTSGVKQVQEQGTMPNIYERCLDAGCLGQAQDIVASPIVQPDVCY